MINKNQNNYRIFHYKKKFGLTKKLKKKLQS